MASRQQPPPTSLLLTLLLLGCSVAVTLVSSTSIAVPSYFYPCTGSSSCKWDMMDNNANAVKIAIINPDSGPGSSVDQNYASQVTRSKTAGISVVGYVHTSYGQVSSSIFRLLSSCNARVADSLNRFQLLEKHQRCDCGGR